MSLNATILLDDALDQKLYHALALSEAVDVGRDVPAHCVLMEAMFFNKLLNLMERSRLVLLVYGYIVKSVCFSVYILLQSIGVHNSKFF